MPKKTVSDVELVALLETLRERREEHAVAASAASVARDAESRTGIALEDAERAVNRKINELTATEAPQ